MKNTALLFLIFTIILSSCKKDKYETEFETSLKKWNEYKASVNNNYSYIAFTASSTGFVSTYVQTTITVKNGIVVGRMYEVGFSSTGPLQKAWTEDAGTLNTHQNGAPAITLDDIYTKAKDDWLKVDNRIKLITLETDSNGLISACGYSEKGCMDYCFTGVHIKSITSI